MAHSDVLPLESWGHLEDISRVSCILHLPPPSAPPQPSAPPPPPPPPSTGTGAGIITTDPSLAVDVTTEVAGGKNSPELALVVTGGGAIVVLVGSATPPAISSTVTVKVDTPLVASVTGSSSAVNEEPLGSIIVVSATVKTLLLSWALTGAGTEELRGEATGVVTSRDIVARLGLYHLSSYIYPCT